VKLRNIAIF